MEKENPFASPQISSVPPHQRMQDAQTSGLTIAERVFLVFCVLGAVILLLCLCSLFFIFLAMVSVKDYGPPLGVHYFFGAMISMGLLGIVVTVSIIFYKQSLSLVPTIVLCGSLLVGCYTIPLAIWGVVLLITRQSRMNVSSTSSR